MGKVSRYRMGWLLVLFDLPVTTAQERKDAAHFRNQLLDSGYLMLQYSAYARSSVTLEKKQGLVNEWRGMVPESGTVQCLFMTDGQWGGMLTLSRGKRKLLRRIDEQPQIKEQLQFW